MDYSILMSVYKSEKAEYLRIAMNSMWNQTVPTNDFVFITLNILQTFNKKRLASIL